MTFNKLPRNSRTLFTRITRPGVYLCAVLRMDIILQHLSTWSIRCTFSLGSNLHDTLMWGDVETILCVTACESLQAVWLANVTQSKLRSCKDLQEKDCCIIECERGRRRRGGGGGRATQGCNYNSAAAVFNERKCCLRVDFFLAHVGL